MISSEQLYLKILEGLSREKKIGEQSQRDLIQLPCLALAYLKRSAFCILTSKSEHGVVQSRKGGILGEIGGQVTTGGFLLEAPTVEKGVDGVNLVEIHCGRCVRKKIHSPLGHATEPHLLYTPPRRPATLVPATSGS